MTAMMTNMRIRVMATMRAGNDDEQGLMLQPEHSLVGVSNTVTHHGVPLLSYTRTMNRFYTTRRQRLSALGALSVRSVVSASAGGPGKPAYEDAHA